MCGKTRLFGDLHGIWTRTGIAATAAALSPRRQAMWLGKMLRKPPLAKGDAELLLPYLERANAQLKLTPMKMRDQALPAILKTVIDGAVAEEQATQEILKTLGAGGGGQP